MGMPIKYVMLLCYVMDQSRDNLIILKPKESEVRISNTISLLAKMPVFFFSYCYKSLTQKFRKTF